MAQPVHRGVQLALDGTLRETKGSGDLSKFQALMMPHDEDHSLPRRQSAYLRFEHPAELAGVRRFFRPWGFFRYVQHLVFGLFAKRCGRRRHVTAAMVDTGVHGDSIHPRGQLGVLAKAGQRPVHFDEDVLRDVFGIVVVARELIRHAVHQGPVSLDEHLKGGVIPGRGAGNQVRVILHPCHGYDAGHGRKVDRLKTSSDVLASKDYGSMRFSNLPFGGFMRSLRRFLAVSILFAGIAAPVAGQSVVEPKTITVTPFLSTTFGTSQGLGSSLGLGAAAGYDWTSNLGVELELGSVFDVAGANDNLDHTLTTFSGNIVYHFDVVRVTPYATLGLGWVRSNPDFKVIDPLALTAPPSTEVAWNVGGGVKYPVNSRILARADLRRFQVTDLAPDHWRLYGGLTFWVRR